MAIEVKKFWSDYRRATKFETNFCPELSHWALRNSEVSHYDSAVLRVTNCFSFRWPNFSNATEFQKGSDIYIVFNGLVVPAKCWPSTCVYICVVLTSLWPNNSWTLLISRPAWSKWVAKLYLNVRQVTRLFIWILRTVFPSALRITLWCKWCL